MSRVHANACGYSMLCAVCKGRGDRNGGDIMPVSTRDVGSSPWQAGSDVWCMPIPMDAKAVEIIK